MTEKEKSYAGILYQPGDPELVADRDITVQKLYAYNNLHRWSAKRAGPPSAICWARWATIAPWNNRYFAPMATTSPWGTIAFSTSIAN